jgi:hypothetical protein
MKRLRRMFSVWVWAASLLSVRLVLVGQEFASKPSVRRAALLVENRAGVEFEKLSSQLEDQFSSRATGQGLVLIGRQLVIDAIAKEGAGAQLDALLSERKSVVRLAQSLGVDWIVLASLSSVTREERTFNDGTLHLTSHNHVLRVTYKIAEAAEPGALAGDSIRVSRNIRGTETTGIDSSEIYSQLVDDAAIRLLQDFREKVIQIAKAEVSRPSSVDISVSAIPVDLNQNPLQLPDLRVGADGSVVKGSSGWVDVVLGDVSIEMDGVLVGTTPATLRLAPGFHKLRLTRPGFGTVEQTINPVTGLKLRPALQMSEADYARWKDNSAFLQAVEVNRKLTDSQVKAVEGFAKMLEHSGYRVDVREDNKIQINGKSLYDGATLQIRNRN